MSMIVREETLEKIGDFLDALVLGASAVALVMFVVLALFLVVMSIHHRRQREILQGKRETIKGYPIDLLEPRLQQEVFSHLEQCDHCRSLREQMESMVPH